MNNNKLGYLLIKIIKQIDWLNFILYNMPNEKQNYKREKDINK